MLCRVGTAGFDVRKKIAGGLGGFRCHVQIVFHAEGVRQVEKGIPFTEKGMGSGKSQFLHERVDAYSLKYKKQIGQILSMHSGINTGLVVTGNVDFHKGTHAIAGAPLNMRHWPTISREVCLSTKRSTTWPNRGKKAWKDMRWRKLTSIIATPMRVSTVMPTNRKPKV